MKTTVSQLVSAPETIYGGVIDRLIEHVNTQIRDAEEPTPVSIARHAQQFLVDQGRPWVVEDIKYDFEDHYRVYFRAEDFPPMVAEFWSPWMGGISWRIEEVA